MKCASIKSCACAATLSSAQGARLFAVARGRGLDPEDARDAVQEALSSFVALAQARDLCAASVDSAAYLTALVINIARNMRRRHHRRKPHARDEVLDRLEAANADVEVLFAQKESARELQGCLETLEDVPRKIVSLRILEDVSGSEVAKLLDLTPNHVAVMLHRAKRSLSVCITRANSPRT